MVFKWLTYVAARGPVWYVIRVVAGGGPCEACFRPDSDTTTCRLAFPMASGMLGGRAQCAQSCASASPGFLRARARAASSHGRLPQSSPGSHCEP